MNLITKLAQLRTDVEKSIAETPPLTQPSTYLLDTVTKLRLIEYLSSNNPTNEPTQIAGGATASNQLLQLERLIEIRDRLPVNGTLLAQSNSRITYQNLGANSSGLVKATSGQILALTIYNESPSTRWIQLFNKNQDNIVEGDFATETYPIFSQVFLILDSNYFGEKGANFNNGIVFGFSATGNSYTPADPDFQLHLKYT